MSTVSPARRAAYESLIEVESGVHSDEVLLRVTAGLDPRDAGLAYEIVLGVLRRQRQLDFLIHDWGGWDAARLDAPVRLALRIGLYQTRFLDRIPRHAAVSESVELVKRAGKRSAAGLVNAILRKDRGQAVNWPDRATEFSTPEWLLARWGEHAAPVGRHSLTVPPSGMDPGARTIVPLLELAPGMRFLDLCAAPGNKTRQALEAEPALVVACDRSARRLSTVPGVRVQLDGLRPLPFRPVFDRVLVDAPCSGTGTLARNPEIKWRLEAADLVRHQRRQLRMLDQARRVVKPGGVLVYATCSLEREENEEVAASLPGAECFRRWPGEDEGDGFFAARWRF